MGVLDHADRAAIELEIKNLHKIYMTSATNSNSSDTEFTATTRTKHESKSNLLQDFLSAVGRRKSRTIREDKKTLSITDELSIYRSLAIQEYNDIVENLKEPDSFSFWKLHGHQLKFLSSLTWKHLIIPSTSAPSESTFSMAAYLGRKERSCLTPDHFSMLVFLKDKVIDNI